MKAISLPIETIIIIAIAVLVLVVLAAFLIGGSGKPAPEVQSALGEGCAKLKSAFNCNEDPSSIIIPRYRPAGETTDQTLAVACENLGYAVAPANSQCHRICGCP